MKRRLQGQKKGMDDFTAWMVSETPAPMLYNAAGKMSRRQRYLVASGCLRNLIPLYSQQRIRDLIDTLDAEAWGKGERPLWWLTTYGFDDNVSYKRALDNLRAHLRDELTFDDVGLFLLHLRRGGMSYTQQADVLRDVLHGLWYPMNAGVNQCATCGGLECFHDEVDACRCRNCKGLDWTGFYEWLTPDVKGLAESMYRSADFRNMPILGDALRDAGCADRYILPHVESDKEHWRGCWVIDFLLGYEPVVGSI